MKFGLGFVNTAPFAGGEAAGGVAVMAEAVGFESIWTIEHVIFPSGYESSYPYARSGRMPLRPTDPLPDPLIWLTWAAALTTRIRLATGIVILPQRNPLVLAKEVATLDHLSGGRVDLGIGVGWLREEFDALGVPWDRRGARTDEYVDVMRTLWRGEEAGFDGEFVSFRGVTSSPTPTRGSVPIVVGGHTRAAAERAGRLGDGFFPAKGDLAGLLEVVRESAERAGRRPEDIEITTVAPDLHSSVDPAAFVEEMAALGVQRLVVPVHGFLADLSGSMERFGEEVIRRS